MLIEVVGNYQCLQARARVRCAFCLRRELLYRVAGGRECPCTGLTVRVELCVVNYQKCVEDVMTGLRGGLNRWMLPVS
jgi:hypothetical protein